jgi:acyl-[acyl-carrier-protein] desaturase
VTTVAGSARREAVRKLYLEFFELAERKRRWSVFDDVPWDMMNVEFNDPDRALCAETFCGIEMYLPDYVSTGINLVRDSFGQAWFHANWAYEESKHGLVLREWLVRTGQRTPDEMGAFEQAVLARRWELPFSTPEQMTAYGLIQETTALVSYKIELEHARQSGDPVLDRIYSLIARDEAAHASFYARVYALLLEEDRTRACADLADVFAGFTMPGDGLVPDYDRRLGVVQRRGMDRERFFTDVWTRILHGLGVTRGELRRASRVLRGAGA